MSHPDPIQLQKLADGELRRGQAGRLESHLADCPECSARVKSIQGLGSLLRTAADDLAPDELFEGLADRILDGVKESRPLPWSERAKAWFEEVLRHRRRVWVPSVSVAAATAVAVLALALVDVNQPLQPVDLPRGSNVLSVSFGTSVNGSLFQLEDKDGSTTAVIWVDEGAPVTEGKRT